MRSLCRTCRPWFLLLRVPNCLKSDSKPSFEMHLDHTSWKPRSRLIQWRWWTQKSCSIWQQHPTNAKSNPEIVRMNGTLKLVTEKLVNVKDIDNTVTHATDSTTRKRVGCFAPQGLHGNKDTYIPLPTLQMGSETTKNISESINTEFKIYLRTHCRRAPFVCRFAHDRCHSS